jgi:hypothetical protein
MKRILQLPMVRLHNVPPKQQVLEIYVRTMTLALQLHLLDYSPFSLFYAGIVLLKTRLEPNVPVGWAAILGQLGLKLSSAHACGRL